MRTWILIGLAIASLLSAEMARAAGTGGGVGGQSSYDMTICLVPDIQNLSSSSDAGGTDASANCSQNVSYCSGSACTSSSYCSGSWYNTGEVLLRNMAFSLTGRWSEIDYSAIKGNDNVVSKRGNPLDHSTCDVIIGLGDNMDTTDGKTYAQLTTAMLHEYSAVLGFWKIIADSGIPFIIARGNHDGEGAFRTMLAAIGVTGKSFYFLGEADGDQYAIKFATKTGKQFCVLTMDYDGVLADDGGGTLSANEKAWSISNVGCGSNLPTILARHEIIQANNTFWNDKVDLIDAVGNDELFMIASGHWVPAIPLSSKGSENNVAGRAVFRFFSNWQEYNRHNTNVVGTGLTASDGIGGMYTVITISPQNKNLCAHDWNPYWQARDAITNSQDNGAVLTSDYCATFDFNARFP